MMQKKMVGMYLMMASACGVASLAAAEDIGFRSNAASAMLNTINPEQQRNLIYINTLNLNTLPEKFSLEQIKGKILQDNMRYFIDFSAIDNEEQKKIAKQTWQHILGVSFPSDWLVIGQYKGKLIYSALSNVHDPMLKTALSRTAEKINIRGKRAADADKPTLPHVAFYLDVNRPISKQECTFPRSQIWSRGDRLFCNNANIALVYRVNLMRSLTHGTVGSATPDAKLVRISLDAESAGAGMQLNNALSSDTQKPDYLLLDGWLRSYANDAIAKDYKFSIAASNTTAAILKTFPASNLNSSYENRDTSGFEIGVTAGAEVGKEGPKATLEAAASYNQSRTLVYKTEDYRVERSAPNAQNISFTWARDQYPTAESLMYKSTATIWGDDNPVDLKRIKPISYQGFIPNFDVIYKAAANATGSTAFTIDSSVNIWPIYTAAYEHYYVFGTHLSFQAKEEWQKYRRIEKPVSFEVDWNHPVFTGGRPVNLQLAGFNNKCVNYGNLAKVEITTCDLKSTAQSFIYDEYGRYASATDINKCLDGDNLGTFAACNANLSQRWTWDANSDGLKNNFYTDKYLTHDINSGQLSLAPQSTANLNTRTITKFTDVFSQ